MKKIVSLAAALVLFLSMLPLHMDRPQKVLAFVLKALDIMEWLDNGKI